MWRNGRNRVGFRCRVRMTDSGASPWRASLTFASQESHVAASADAMASLPQVPQSSAARVASGPRLREIPFKELLWL